MNKHYPDKLRRIKLADPDTGQQLVFLTNRIYSIKRWDTNN